MVDLILHRVGEEFDVAWLREPRYAGTIALGHDGASDFQYDITRADLAALEPLTRRSIAGLVSTKGTLTGPLATLHATGDASVNQLDAFGLNGLTMTGRYDVTIPADDPAAMAARLDGCGSFLTMFGRTVEQASGTLSLVSNLSRILCLRATFSDAQSLTARTPFRRIERAGIDLLVFLSF